MDASKLPKGQSKELPTDGRPINLPGVYVHKDTKAKFITAEGESGVVQADALQTPIWQRAWERVGDVPSREELLAAQKAAEAELPTETVKTDVDEPVTVKK